MMRLKLYTTILQKIYELSIPDIPDVGYAIENYVPNYDDNDEYIEGNSIIDCITYNAVDYQYVMADKTTAKPIASFNCSSAEELALKLISAGIAETIDPSRKSDADDEIENTKLAEKLKKMKDLLTEND